MNDEIVEDVFSSTDQEAENDKTKSVLVKYLGIDADEWPVCKQCGEKLVVFNIMNPQYFELDKTRLPKDRKSKVYIRCTKCRRRTKEFHDIRQAIWIWNKEFNYI